MKKLILPVLVFCLCSVTSQSQNLRLNLYSAYAFPDAFDSYYDATNYYNGQIQGGYQWGGGLEYMVKPNYGVELLYLRESTTAPSTYYKNGIQTDNFNLDLNYVMLGGDRLFKAPSGKVEGFFGLMAGMVIANIQGNNYNSTPTKFAWGLRGGATLWPSPKVGIKLQIQLLSAVQAFGGGLYFGTGGVGAGVTTYSTIYQFGMGGGLVFPFGSK